MKLIVEYTVEGIVLEKEFNGDDPIALVEEAKADVLFKQCTNATFEIIEEDDGAQ
jgi:hypothetical protein